MNGSDAPLRPKLVLSEMEETDLTRWIRTLAQIRSSRKELIYGEYVELLLTNRQYVYGRRFEGDACIVALNNDDSEASVDINLPISGSSICDLMSGQVLPAESGRVHMVLQGHEGRIYQVK